MKYRKILLKYNVYFQKVVFSQVKHNKKSYNIIHHVKMGGFKSIRKQMYKLYIE